MDTASNSEQIDLPEKPETTKAQREDFREELTSLLNETLVPASLLPLAAVKAKTVSVDEKNGRKPYEPRAYDVWRARPFPGGWCVVLLIWAVTDETFTATRFYYGWGVDGFSPVSDRMEYERHNFDSFMLDGTWTWLGNIEDMVRTAGRQKP